MADNFGTAQSKGTNGGRYDGLQQDAIFAGNTASITTANGTIFRRSTGAKAVLAKTLKGADELTSDFVKGGSTASVAILTPDKKLPHAQVGDSPIYVFIHDKKTGRTEVVNLTKDHTPRADRERIEATGAKVLGNGYLYFKDEGEDGDEHYLAMSRAFGDGAFRQYITATPDINVYDLEPHISADKRIIVVIGSDGLTDVSSLEDMASLIDADKTPQQIAIDMMNRALVDWETHVTDRAAKKGKRVEGDNISVSVAEFDPDSEISTVIGVADGHGRDGEYVADIIKRTVQQDVGLEVDQPLPAKTNILDTPGMREGFALAMHSMGLAKQFREKLGKDNIHGVTAKADGSIHVKLSPDFDAARLSEMGIDNPETLEAKEDYVLSIDDDETRIPVNNVIIPKDRVPSALKSNFDDATLTGPEAMYSAGTVYEETSPKPEEYKAYERTVLAYLQSRLGSDCIISFEAHPTDGYHLQLDPGFYVSALERLGFDLANTDYLEALPEEDILYASLLFGDSNMPEYLRYKNHKAEELDAEHEAAKTVKHVRDEDVPEPD